MRTKLHYLPIDFSSPQKSFEIFARTLMLLFVANVWFHLPQPGYGWHNSITLGCKTDDLFLDLVSLLFQFVHKQIDFDADRLIGKLRDRLIDELYRFCLAHYWRSAIGNVFEKT